MKYMRSVSWSITLQHTWKHTPEAYSPDKPSSQKYGICRQTHIFRSSIGRNRPLFSDDWPRMSASILTWFDVLHSWGPRGQWVSSNLKVENEPTTPAEQGLAARPHHDCKNKQIPGSHRNKHMHLHYILLFCAGSQCCDQLMQAEVSFKPQIWALRQ